MTLPTPPKYVVIPAEAIEQAFALDKPRRALLATFVRLLSLAWEHKYEQTPRLREDELFDGVQPGFLRLSRRQYFEQKADMELLGWLRSTHPVPGFVQFTFSKVAALEAVGAENRIASAENRTVLSMEEEDSLAKLKPDSSSSLNTAVRKIAPVQKSALSALWETEPGKALHTLIEHLPILFDPEIYGGPLDERDSFLVCLPDYAKGWIAKAYKERENLNRGGGPLGLIVNGLNSGQAPHRWYLDHVTDVLPESYLEAIGELEYTCTFCPMTCTQRAALDEHMRQRHPYICDECREPIAFETQALWQAHYQATHETYTQPKASPVIEVTVLDGSLNDTWQSVLGELQQTMPRASFETWVQGTQVLRYDGNVLVIGTRNAYARDWLANRLTKTVERLLIGIANRSDLTVRFETVSEAGEPA